MKSWVFLKGGRLIFPNGIYFLIDGSLRQHSSIRAFSPQRHKYGNNLCIFKYWNEARAELFTGIKSFSEIELVVELAVNSFTISS